MDFEKRMRQQRGMRVPSPATAISDLYGALRSNAERVIVLDTDLGRVNPTLPGLISLTHDVWLVSGGAAWDEGALDCVRMWVEEYRCSAWFVLADDSTLLADVRRSFPLSENLEDLRPIVRWLSAPGYEQFQAELLGIGRGKCILSFAGEDSFSIIGTTRD